MQEGRSGQRRREVKTIGAANAAGKSRRVEAANAAEKSRRVGAANAAGKSRRVGAANAAGKSRRIGAANAAGKSEQVGATTDLGEGLSPNRYRSRQSGGGRSGLVGVAAGCRCLRASRPT